MAFFDKVSGFAKNVSDKGSSYIEITRLKSRINSIEETIPTAKQELGELIWNKYQQGETLDPQFAEICADIQSKLDEIASVQAEIQNIKDQETIASNPGTRPCPQCGALVGPDSKFCPKCGAHVPELQPEAAAEPEAAEKPVFCPQCGAACTPGSKFCTSCGAQIK